MSSVKITRNGDMSAALRQIGANLKAAKVRIGIFENATTDDGKLIAEYATYNEFGTEHIPARPFMRNTIKEHTGDWLRTFAGMIAGQAEDPVAVDRALRMVGVQAVGHIQDMIDSNMPPDNAPSTKERKRKIITGANGRPMKNEAGEVMTHIPGTLVNTGAMRKAIAFEVNPE